MGIGTSMGAFHEDDFAHIASPWMEKPENTPDKNTLSPNEIMPPDTGVDPKQYETPLLPDEEIKFQDWKSRMAPTDSGEDYDLRGAFKAGAAPDAQSGHWPDTFKKPNHPTFSNQSMYAIDRPDLAGSWNGDLYVSPKATEITMKLPVPANDNKGSYLNLANEAARLRQLIEQIPFTGPKPVK